jgi:hypothetical protein
MGLPSRRQRGADLAIREEPVGEENRDVVLDRPDVPRQGQGDAVRGPHAMFRRRDPAHPRPPVDLHRRHRPLRRVSPGRPMTGTRPGSRPLQGESTPAASLSSWPAGRLGHRRRPGPDAVGRPLRSPAGSGGVSDPNSRRNRCWPPGSRSRVGTAVRMAADSSRTSPALRRLWSGGGSATDSREYEPDRSLKRGPNPLSKTAPTGHKASHEARGIRRDEMPGPARISAFVGPRKW